MNVKCVNRKEFKNLTLNKDYDATEENDMFVLTNDAGLSVRYAKKYFTTVVVPPAPRGVPIAEALHVEITSVSDVTDEVIVCVTIGRHRSIVMSLNRNNTSVSCGVNEVANIAELKHICGDLYNRLDHNLYTGTLGDLFRAVITPMFEEIKSTVGACFIMSDALRIGDEEMDALLLELSTVHWSGLNINSGNDIVLWIFNK